MGWKMKSSTAFALVIACLACATAPGTTKAQESDLAKTSQNPLGNIYSLPIETHIFTNIGPSKATALGMIAKPIVPLKVGEFNLINRFILPVFWSEGQSASTFSGLAAANPGRIDTAFGSLSPKLGSAAGLGDFTYQLFVSPANPGKIIWGAGPVFTAPTHTDDRFGVDKWSGGPAAVVLTMPGPWVLGFLAQHFWSFAGSSSASEVNKSSLQIIANYNFDNGWYLTSTPTMSYNWSAATDRWTVPIGGGVGKLVKFGNQSVDFKIVAYNNVVRSGNANDWDAQFTVKFLFPKK